MAKIYTKNTWVDEVLSDTEKYQVKDDSGVIVYDEAEISLATGVVTPGTPVNASMMNNIEDGIDGLDDLLNERTAEATAANDFMVGKADGTWEKKTLAQVKTILGVDVQRIQKTIITPQAVYASRPQIPIFRAAANLTITRIHVVINDSTPGAELAGDLKFADDLFVGSLANATVIDACDTTSGVFTATSSFDDATVPSGKYVYFQLDASPHADILDIFIEIFYTFD